MKTTLDPSSPMERHSRKCAICTHPDREAIDQAFLNGSRKPDIVKHYTLPTLSSLYRHAHATGLCYRKRIELQSNSNRESSRLETPATPSKQSLEHDSNRENRASTTELTQTKSQPNSNRENRPEIGFMTPEIQRMLIGK